MLYKNTDNYTLYLGKMQEELSNLPEASVDCIVTDPPYELNFMGNGWDNSGVAFQKETWEHCHRVLKPGGYLLAFGGSRTFHRIACAIEDAGFEIRDTIMWLYGSGFPKSMNVGLAIDKANGVESTIVGYQGDMPDFEDVCKKQQKISGVHKLSFGQVDSNERKANPIYKATNEWDGWGTCLKPAYEPIIVARKPFNGSLIDNVQKNGVGALNIDGCRIPLEAGYVQKTTQRHARENVVFSADTCGFDSTQNTNASANPDGRFPANVILTYDESDEQEVCGGFPIGGKNGSLEHSYDDNSNIYGHRKMVPAFNSYNDSGSAARYFYCAKASKKDRDEGLDLFDKHKCSMLASNANIDKDGNFTGMLKGRDTKRANIHPTVKPTELMQYLIRLVSPKGAIILDPFMGSGSTGKACMIENTERNSNYKFIGIEMTEQYLPIAEGRIQFGLDFIHTNLQISSSKSDSSKASNFKLFDM